MEKNKSFLEQMDEYQMEYNEVMLDLKWYAIKSHAEIVCKKCMRAGKYNLAQKIAYKYGLQITGDDDTVIALNLALMCSKK